MTRKHCPTCGGRGTVDKVYGPNMVMGYCDREGNSWPQEQCQNCCGQGWVGPPISGLVRLRARYGRSINVQRVPSL